MHRGSIVRVITLALLWGSSFLWIKVALRGLSPVQIVVVRLALGALVLLAILACRGVRLPRQPALWGHLTVAAFFANAVPYLLFAIGEQNVDSSIAGVLNATTPLWTVALALATGHDRRVSAGHASGLALGFAGTLLSFSPWRSGSEIASWGGLACLLAAASYGVSYIYMDRHLAGQGIEPIVLSASQLVAATGLLALVTPFAGLQPVHLRLDALASVAILGALGTGAAYVLNYRLITDEGSHASIVTYLLPVVSVLLGALVLSEPLTAPVVGGVAVVLLGVALARRRTRAPERASAH